LARLHRLDAVLVRASDGGRKLADDLVATLRDNAESICSGLHDLASAVSMLRHRHVPLLSDVRGALSAEGASAYTGISTMANAEFCSRKTWHRILNAVEQLQAKGAGKRRSDELASQGFGLPPQHLLGSARSLRGPQRR
jgi:hypothetical protein